MKEKFNVTVPLRRRGTAYQTGPQREAPMQVRGRKEQGEGTSHSLYYARKARQGRVNSLGLTSLKNFRGLWGHRGRPQLTSWLVQERENIGLVCESWIKEVVQSMASKFVCFFFFLIFWLHRVACGLLVPQPGRDACSIPGLG